MAVSLEGLHPTLMRPRVEALLADAEVRKLGLYVVSAFRSIERQRVLFEAAVKKYGSVAAARKWVAPPGKSNHGPRVDGYGTAVDLGLPGIQAVSGQWPPNIEAHVNRIAARHGLYSPMAWEDWHFEPINGWTPPEEDEDEVAPQYEAIQRISDKAIALVAPGFFKHIDGERWEYAKANNLCQVVPREVNDRGWDLERDIAFGGEEPEARRAAD